MALKESGEMYLETILILSEQMDSVRAIDVGEKMGFSKPSVSRAMGILKEEEFITVALNGAITLTDKGRGIAEKIYERHQVLTKCLQYIGVDERTASEDACRIEHVISEKAFEEIKTYMKKQRKE